MFHKDTCEPNFYNCTREQGLAQEAQMEEHTSWCRKWLWSLGQASPLGREMATHSSILAWEAPWTEQPRGYRAWDPKGSGTTEHTWTQKYVQRQWLNYLIRWSPPTLWRIICFTQMNINVIWKVYLLSNIQTSDWPYIQEQWSCQVDT